ncbi:serine protease [Nonomuraea deserti]|uniref:Serine protease n=1 Tax=Nonomuraea deserti TaxID=1848322 RepID=A0A4R4VFF6_9ACTN|nr:S8 family serine peptidase [Nonomuraea deserti]TDD04288.1 serine protease [Nonomuraea deserti]
MSADALPRLSWYTQDRPEQVRVSAGWPAAPVEDWATSGATGAGVRVCVVDSGVEDGHELVGQLAGAYSVEPGPEGSPRVVPDNRGDSSGHGTACASVIRRFAPGCELVSVRVLGGFFGSSENLVTALRWVIDNGFDVVNLSLSTSKRTFGTVLRELTDDAYFNRTLIVASAHNMKVESFPWRFSSVVSVGSHAEADPWLYYYNPAPPVEFYAGGVNVPVAWKGGARTLCSGNSFATPRMAGICALILSKYPELTPFQVKTALYLSAANVREQP